jgi:NAD(P)-dependent dehydrogenase (short-subunit alcohol dehydrogenase family)
MAQQNSAVWFITGCSTGFGRELAKILLARGNRVVVTARNPRQIEDLAVGQDGKALALELDVTNPAQIAIAVKKAEAAFGQIDVLVNNAGYGYLSALEEGEYDEVRALFETNFFGLAELTKALLPGMRRRHTGTVVNISSIGGFVGFPGIGYYNATKFAVEGLTEALAKECEPLGIRAMIVEPGPFRTDWAGRSLKTPKHPIGDYAATAGARRNAISSGSGKQAGDPVRACHAMIQAVESAKPPMRLVLGRMALDTAKAKLAQVQADLDTWKETTLGADYPESQASVAR